MKKVSVRLSRREVAFLREVARREGLPSLSFLLREAVRYFIAKELSI